MEKEQGRSKALESLKAVAENPDSNSESKKEAELMIVDMASRAEKEIAAESEIKAKGFSAMLAPVLAVKLSHQVGQLQVLLAEICKAGINIEYMYALATGKDDASIVIKTADLEKAAEVLKKTGVELVTADEL